MNRSELPPGHPGVRRVRTDANLSFPSIRQRGDQSRGGPGDPREARQRPRRAGMDIARQTGEDAETDAISSPVQSAVGLVQTGVDSSIAQIAIHVIPRQRQKGPDKNRRGATAIETPSRGHRGGSRQTTSPAKTVEHGLRLIIGRMPDRDAVRPPSGGRLGQKRISRLPGGRLPRSAPATHPPQASARKWQSEPGGHAGNVTRIRGAARAARAMIQMSNPQAPPGGGSRNGDQRIQHRQGVGAAGDRHDHARTVRHQRFPSASHRHGPLERVQPRIVFNHSLTPRLIRHIKAHWRNRFRPLALRAQRVCPDARQEAQTEKQTNLSILRQAVPTTRHTADLLRRPRMFSTPAASLHEAVHGALEIATCRLLEDRAAIRVSPPLARGPSALLSRMAQEATGTAGGNDVPACRQTACTPYPQQMS